MSLVVALALLGALPVQARDADQKTVTARNFAYEPTPTTVDSGESLFFANADGAPHNVVARQNGTDGKPAFASDTIGQNETTPVRGVEQLLAGSYPFYCTIHPQMAGTLTVGASAPDPGGVDGPVIVNVPTPTSITSRAGSLYVASYAAGSIFKLPLLPGGVPGPAEPFITGLSSPLGVVVGADGTTYVSDSHAAATPGRTTSGRVWAVPPGGGDVATAGQIVVDELPNGRHNTNGLAIHDGRLYITNGNSTDDGTDTSQPERPLSGTLLSVPESARGIVIGQPSEQQLRVEATGMRNVYDVAFRPGTTEAWLPMNGLDAQDPWGEDLLLLADVSQPTDPLTPPPAPEDFGFPGCVYAEGFSPNYRQNANTAVTDRCDGTQKLPEQLLGLHTSADGLAFGPQSDAYWDGDLFIALFGNFFGDEVVGHRIVRVPIDAAGKAGAPADLITTPAPLDVTFVGSDMYVADFAVGVLLVKPGL
jgi:plastocyanin